MVVIVVEVVLLQGLCDKGRLPATLSINGHVLELAASTSFGYGTNRCHSIRAGLENLDQIGLRVGGIVAKDAEADRLTGNDVGDHDDPLFVVAVLERNSSDAPPSVGERLNLGFEFVVVVEGVTDELFGDGCRRLEEA